jgi:hypothetical protein
VSLKLEPESVRSSGRCISAVVGAELVSGLNTKSSTYSVELLGGSDGARIITYDFSDARLYERQEIVDPILLSPPQRSQRRYSVPLTHIPQDQWEEVAQRHAHGESLRRLGRVYGISYEAIRQIVLKVTKDR